MTHLDSIFKNRDITLPIKVRLVKAMVFPAVMYGCESWTVKKAEHQRIDEHTLSHKLRCHWDHRLQILLQMWSFFPSKMLKLWRGWVCSFSITLLITFVNMLHSD